MKINKSFLGLVAACMALLFATSSSAQDVVTYYHTDASGSPIAATDANGNILWREDFAPYGERLRQENSPRTNRMWFTGHHHDDDTGLTYAGARHYDPMIGRFTAIDPAGTTPEDQFSFNRYVYGNDNPHRYVDPDGEFPIAAGVTILVGGTIYIAGCHVSGSCQKFGEDVWRGVRYLGERGALPAGMLMASSRKVSHQNYLPPDTYGTPPDPEDPFDWNKAPQSASFTVWNAGSNSPRAIRGARVDIENPNPGQRPGQVHLQIGDNKWLYRGDGRWQGLGQNSRELSNSELDALSKDQELANKLLKIENLFRK